MHRKSAIEPALFGNGRTYYAYPPARPSTQISTMEMGDAMLALNQAYRLSVVRIASSVPCKIAGSHSQLFGIAGRRKMETDERERKTNVW